jgi:hypothetical protein
MHERNLYLIEYMGHGMEHSGFDQKEQGKQAFEFDGA